MPSLGKKVVVIGGGISGLSAAYDLTRAGIDCTVIEKQARVGGVIETRVIAECVLESGPDSFLSAKPEAFALIKELGLENDVIGSNDRNRTTYIVRRGHLTKLPEGVMMIVPSRVMPMVKTNLLGWPTKIRMGLEYFRKPGQAPKDGRDRSVAEFVTDHFGQETLDYLAEPLLSGVYGGDPAQLSVASVLPRFLEMERKYGSLVRGALASRTPTTTNSRKTGPAPAPLFRTLKRGLGSMVDALAARVTVSRASAEKIEKTSGGFRVRAHDNWIEADQVIVACPAWSAAGLVAPLDPPLADLLGGIDYSSSLMLALVYKAQDFNGMRAGFGFLVPKKERKRLAACTFVGTKFSDRVPGDRIALRCFFGGIGDSAVLEEPDERIVAIAREELRTILGLTAAPIETKVSRWPHSMAQYAVGHQKRVESIRARAAAIPGLHLAGNAYEGIGIPDCIRTGRAAAARIIANTLD
jgi:protoporphyrinogen/coproporphyrinogen III oxidase